MSDESKLSQAESHLREALALLNNHGDEHPRPRDAWPFGIAAGKGGRFE